MKYKVFYKRTIEEYYTEEFEARSEREIRKILENSNSSFFENRKPTHIKEIDIDIIGIDEI